MYSVENIKECKTEYDLQLELQEVLHVTGGNKEFSALILYLTEDYDTIKKRKYNFR